MWSMFEPMPSMRAPIFTSIRQRSCTCGSQAVLMRQVRPGARTAAITAFSVPVTLGSSRNTSVPLSPFGAAMSMLRSILTSAPSPSHARVCVSMRRRPMTSPPGGGTVTCPQRASSGPANRMEARMRLQSVRSSFVFAMNSARISRSFWAVHWTEAPRSAASSHITSTSRMRGTLDSRTGRSVSNAAAMMGSAAFLLPSGAIDPDRGRPPSMTKYSLTACRASIVATGRHPPSRGSRTIPPMSDLVHDRDAAWALLTEYTKSEALRRHALAVEAAVRYYARLGGEDEDAWGNVALLHDFDYEVHPTLDKHPQDGAPILREW